MHVEGGLEKNRNYYIKLEGKLRVRGVNYPKENIEVQIWGKSHDKLKP